MILFVLRYGCIIVLLHIEYVYINQYEGPIFSSDSGKLPGEKVAERNGAI